MLSIAIQLATKVRSDVRNAENEHDGVQRGQKNRRRRQTHLFLLVAHDHQRRNAGCFRSCSSAPMRVVPRERSGGLGVPQRLY